MKRHILNLECNATEHSNECANHLLSISSEEFHTRDELAASQPFKRIEVIVEYKSVCSTTKTTLSSLSRVIVVR